LQASDHHVMMITGDAALTGAAPNPHCSHRLERAP
jgi:hypothetical protein